MQGIVVPHTIAANFGDHNKALVLATLGTLGTVMSFAGPFTGSLSDRCVLSTGGAPAN